MQSVKVQTRYEGDLIPQGISVTDMPARVHIYLRVGDQIATIKLPKSNWQGDHGMYYEVVHSE